jgi:hypothetical protein
MLGESIPTNLARTRWNGSVLSRFNPAHALSHVGGVEVHNTGSPNAEGRLGLASRPLVLRLIERTEIVDLGSAPLPIFSTSHRPHRLPPVRVCLP